MQWIKSQFAVLWWSQILWCAMFVFFTQRCSVKWNYLQCCGFLCGRVTWCSLIFLRCCSVQDPPIVPSLHKMVEYLTEGQEVIFLDCYRMQPDKFSHSLIHLKLLVLLTIILMQGGRRMYDGILYLTLWKYMLRKSWTVLGSSLHGKEEYRYTSLFWRNLKSGNNG